MASSANVVPNKYYVQNVLDYLNILYPNGEPIDPVEKYDSEGYVIYKTEVLRFMQLILVWAQDNNYDMTTTDRMTYDLEKIATANWKEIRQMLSYMLRVERLSSFTYSSAIKSGRMQQILLRMKKLAEQ